MVDISELETGIMFCRASGAFGAFSLKSNYNSFAAAGHFGYFFGSMPGPFGSGFSI